MCSKAHYYEKNRSNLVMCSKAKYEKNRSNLVTYSKTKYYEKNDQIW